MDEVVELRACALFGHRDSPESIAKVLYNAIERVIAEEDVKVFYVGTQGSFDRIAYRVLCELENKYSIEIKVVLAYLQTDKNSYYDYKKTVFPDVLENTPRKYAIIKRNNYMIDNSDYIVCYVENSFTNAYTFVKRAIRKNLKIKNIGSYKFK